MSANGSRAGFDANARAARREAGVVTLGDSTYHPVRLTNSRLREVRALAQKANAMARKAGRDSEEYRDAYQDAIDSGIEEKEARSIAEDAGAAAEAVSEINQESLMTQLPILLRTEDDRPPSEEEIRRHLEDDLDARDIGDLMTYLLGGEDPTPASAETTSTSR